MPMSNRKLHQVLCYFSICRIKVAQNKGQLLHVGRVCHLISNHRVELGLSHTFKDMQVDEVPNDVDELILDWAEVYVAYFGAVDM